MLIPEGYVSDLNVRLALYRRLSTLETDDAIGTLRKQLTDAGVVFVKPSDADVAALRARLIAAEPAVATETNMDAAFVAKYQAELRAAQSR